MIRMDALKSIELMIDGVIALAPSDMIVLRHIWTGIGLEAPQVRVPVLTT